MQRITVTDQSKKHSPINLSYISSENGVWLGVWREFQLSPYQGMVQLFSKVSKEEFEHAIYGYVTPLISRLGPEPEYCLSMLNLECRYKEACVMYTKMCIPSAGMPQCFEPIVDTVHSQVREVIVALSHAYYLIVVE
jgi:hypothetical protein